jgi:S1-C subfamily serine protease
MARRTHYDVLGVARDASSVDIAAAYRDKVADLESKPEAGEAVAALREAYQALASPDRRAEYDRELDARQPARRRAASPAGAPISGEGAGRPFLKYAIPAALVVVAVVGWKMRAKPRPPEAQVVSTVRFEEPAREARPARVEEPGVQPAARTVAAAPSLSPEQLFASVSPSVVRVLAGDTRQGSGVVIESGSVITNCHVTRDAPAIRVKAGAEVLPATVAVADESLDLCSLEVPHLAVPAAAMGTVEDLRTGQRVYAIGAPMGLELTISEGIVSALREVDTGKVIQTTAPVSPGSSGGGLFTADGRLVGIVTFQHKFGQNLNFALPADWIAEMRHRKGGPAPASARPTSAAAAPAEDASPAELVVGSWHCFGSLSGRNGTYSYGKDGVVRVRSNDGRDFAAAYRVTGSSIRYAFPGESVVFQIESISPSRMVQFIEAGQRLACERS